MREGGSQPTFIASLILGLLSDANSGERPGNDQYFNFLQMRPRDKVKFGGTKEREGRAFGITSRPLGTEEKHLVRLIFFV